MLDIVMLFRQIFQSYFYRMFPIRIKVCETIHTELLQYKILNINFII